MFHSDPGSQYASEEFWGILARFGMVASMSRKEILRGYQREETERIIAFRSHWGFASEYCNPARGNEKGGVEGELGWFRRNWLGGSTIASAEAAPLH
jgi:transposase InsO family protein